MVVHRGETERRRHPGRCFSVAQRIKNLPAMWETWVSSLGGEDPLEKGKATHSCILAWKILWTIQLPRVGQDWVTFTWDQHLLSRILPVSTPRRVFFRHPGALLWKLNHQGRQDPQLPVSARGQESNSYQPANIDDLTTTSNLPQHPPTVFN